MEFHRLPYVELIGGILSLPVKTFLRVNGFSNLYWGWGAEDDDMFIRLTENRIPITRADINISRFHMLPHKPSPAFPEHLRARILSLSKSLYRLDGLNSLNFTIIEEKIYSSQRPFTVSQAHNPGATTQVRAVVTEAIYPVLHLRIEVGTPPNWLRGIEGAV
ncbi:unnamed protein product [Dicrocoelium dendriticum]|nr:unnamed protein product [Dicrocoelium dendriticum]